MGNGLVVLIASIVHLFDSVHRALRSHNENQDRRAEAIGFDVRVGLTTAFDVPEEIDEAHAVSVHHQLATVSAR